MKQGYHLGKTPMPKKLRKRDAERQQKAALKAAFDAWTQAEPTPEERSKLSWDALARAAAKDIAGDNFPLTMRDEQSGYDPSCVEYLRDLKPARQRDEREIGFTADDDEAR